MAATSSAGTLMQASLSSYLYGCMCFALKLVLLWKVQCMRFFTLHRSTAAVLLPGKTGLPQPVPYSPQPRLGALLCA